MTDKTDAWMPLWIGAYLADTTSLTTLQHGAYMLLLMAYWRERGPLLDDDEDLRSITKTDEATWVTLRPKMLRFFKVVDGRWTHKRVEAEILSANSRKAGAVAKAKAAAEARWGKENADAPSIPQALLKECPTPSPTEKIKREPPNPRRRRGSGARFDDFWLAWPKNERKQDKAKCLDHWRLHNLDTVADKIAVDVRTKRGTEKWREGHIEAPLTYLRGRRWEDGQEPNDTLGGAIVAWDANGQTIEAKGVELGLGRWDRNAFDHGEPDAETFGAYTRRVRALVEAAEAVPA